MNAHPAAELLHLAAAPSFALMAVLTAFPGGGMPDMICGHAAPPLGGMLPMYVLMSVFHAPPWLKLLSRFASRTARRAG
jgi:hypothetical protein